MSLFEDLLATMVSTSEMSESDLLFLFSKGERKRYAPGEYLFHAGSPNLWAGIIEDGRVEMERERNGSKTLISVLSKGATIAETAIMGGTNHDASAFTRSGVTVWQVRSEIWQATRQSHPDIYYRIVGRVALRLRYAADQLNLYRETLREHYDQVRQEGWLSKEVLDDILKP
jgi:CRP-like cAMP-binding protein